MPTEEKPSRNEDEYFARQNADLIKEHRARLDAERTKREGAAKAMTCPRCGGTLEEQRHHEVVIDQCTQCRGVWLDAGELELLEATSQDHRSSFLGAIFKRGK